MIIDTLANSAVYSALHPGIKAAFVFLLDPATAALSAGKYEINGQEIFAIIEDGDGKGQSNPILEVHQKYIDVQLVVKGDEWMGWSPIASCTLDEEGFNSEKDIGFCNEQPQAWFHVQPGQFVIFYPSDAHAPLCGTGQVSKIVVKVSQ